MKPKLYCRVYADADFGEKGWAYIISLDKEHERVLESGNTYDHDKDESIAFVKCQAKSLRKRLPDEGKRFFIDGDKRIHRGVPIFYSEPGDRPGCQDTRHWCVEERTETGHNVFDVHRVFFRTLTEAKQFINNLINNKS